MAYKRKREVEFYWIIIKLLAELFDEFGMHRRGASWPSSVIHSGGANVKYTAIYLLAFYTRAFAVYCDLLEHWSTDALQLVHSCFNSRQHSLLHSCSLYNQVFVWYLSQRFNIFNLLLYVSLSKMVFHFYPLLLPDLNFIYLLVLREESLYDAIIKRRDENIISTIQGKIKTKILRKL